MLVSLAPLDEGSPEILSSPAAAEIGRPLKVTQDRGVWAGRLAAREVVFKLRRLRGLTDQVRFWLKVSPLDRELFGTSMLKAAGVPTAIAIARGRARWNGPAACVVLELLPGSTMLAHLASGDLSVSQEHGLATMLGEQVAHFVACGIFNRDHKPSNLIVTEPGQPMIDVPARVAVIDAAGVAKGAKPKRMLASLYIEPLGCRCPPRRALVMRCLLAYVRSVVAGVTGADASRDAERAAVKDLWRAVAQIITEHGDPTPADDPLGG
jgi:hypothetical protein